jgi:isovaleryl-CoA dehydrogenase
MQSATIEPGDEPATPPLGTWAGAPLRETIAAFALDEVAPRAAASDRSAMLDRQLLTRAGALGLLGLTIPIPDGGRGEAAYAAVLAHEELASADPGFAIAFLAHTILFAHNFCRTANAEQRARVLPRVLRAQWIGAMAMTEPSGGTDVLAMKTRAERRRDGYRLHGRKTFITNAPDAHCFLVYAKLDGEITTFLVERTSPGFGIGPPIAKMGMRAAPMAELVFDACPVPRQNLLGRERCGLVQMLHNLEIERLCLAAMSIGLARRCLEEIVAFAAQPGPDGELAVESGHVQRLLAESYARSEAARCLVYDVARGIDNERSNRLGSDAAKLFAAQVGKEVADHAVQVLGMVGLCRERGIERLLRDAKLLEIGGGTIEAHQRNIARELTRREQIARRRGRPS